jgi:hypothetical protein
MRRRSVRVAILGLFFVQAMPLACSGSGAASKDGGVSSSRVCVPGLQVPCACPAGTLGEQACEVGGLGYGACDCSGASGPGSSSTTGATSAATSNASSGGGTSGDTGSGSGVSSGSAAGSGTGSTLGSGSSSASVGGPCPYASNDTVDHDGDGWANADGDCNDCNKFINPGAYDLPGDGVDQDCDGKADDEPTGCDSALTAEATTDGSDGATAIDLCRKTTAAPLLPMKTWGVISASYVLPDGTSTQASNANFELGFGILGPTFGSMNSAQQGNRMLGLSSGTARLPADPGYSDGSAAMTPGFDKGYTSGAPAGFPGQTPACPGVTFGAAHDGAALSVVLRVPTNALTMSFDSNFFSSEFPDYVCSPYNDTYVVIMTPAAPGEPATANNNVAFDLKGNIISVNAGFLTVCDANTMAGMTTYACAQGPAKLAGTGFAAADSLDKVDHAATDWLTTTVDVSPLAGNEITLLFAIWDSTDGLLDSTVLIDDVHWTFATAADTPTPAVVPPVTSPH